MLVGSRFHVLFHSPPGVLFTFPSRYCFTIGHSGIFSLTRWSSLIHTGFHVPHATRDTTGTEFGFRLQDFHLLWCSIPLLCLTLFHPLWLSHYPICNYRWFRLLPFRSPLHRKSLLLSLPPATKMFQLAGLARAGLYIQPVVFGLPHSDISGSMLASSSPELFVGNHVLLRLCVPRYPPSALYNLTTFLHQT